MKRRRILPRPEAEGSTATRRYVVTSLYTHTTTPYYPVTSDAPTNCTVSLLVPQRIPSHPTSGRSSPSRSPSRSRKTPSHSARTPLAQSTVDPSDDLNFSEILGSPRPTPFISAYVPPVQSPSPSVPLKLPVPPPETSETVQDASARILATGVPPFVAAPPGRTWQSTHCAILPTKLSGFYNLPQDVISLIVDHLAQTESSQYPCLSPHFPRDLPKADLASCSLSCRAFNPLCSRYLLAYFHFEPPGYRLTQSEGEEVYHRFVDFLELAQKSRRIRTYIKGVSLLWGLGMPAFVKLIDMILGALPKLVVVKLYDAPCGSMPIIPLPSPSQRRTIDTLELGMADARPVVSAQQWLVEYLRLFHRITHLRLEWVISISDKHEIIRTNHLQVQDIHLRFSCPTIFRVLEQVIVPWSVTKLCVQYDGSWSSEQGNIAAMNSFLRTCGQNLEHFWLWAFAHPRRTEPADELRLPGLAACPRLEFVHVTSCPSGWDFQDVYRDVLSCLPQTVRRVVVEHRVREFPSRPEIVDLVDWQMLEDALTALPGLASFELRLTWISMECLFRPLCSWDCAEQERAMAAEALEWLFRLRDEAQRLPQKYWSIVRFKAIARATIHNANRIRCDMRFTMHEGRLTTEHVGCSWVHEIPTDIKRMPTY